MLLFVRGYYASGKTKRPLIVNAVSSLLIVILGFMFVHVFNTYESFRLFIESLLRVEDVPGTAVLMLPLAYAIGMIINAGVFWILFRKDFGGHLPSSLYQTLWQSFSAAVIAGFVAYMVLYTLGSIVSLETASRVFIQALAAGVAGILADVFVLRLLKNRELTEIGKALHGKFYKATAVVPETQEL